MALVLADRVQETTTTTGTGTITLAGAVAGFQSFSVIGNGNTTYYTIISGNNWEVGIGTYTSAGTTLARTTILSSSNAGSAITLSGTSNVFVTAPSSRTTMRDGSNVLTLQAGTTTAAPLAFQSGTNLTTATAGAMEYDGKVIYGTPQGTQRGVVPGMQYYFLNSNYVGSNVSTAQSLFGVGVTLSSSTVYEFEHAIILTKSTGSGSHTIGFSFGGTATVNNISWLVFDNFGSAPSGTAPWNFSSGAASSASNATSTFVATSTIANASVYYYSIMKGTVSINAGGTFIPQYVLSAAPGGAYSTLSNSFIKIWPIGASGANVSVGTWA